MYVISVNFHYLHMLHDSNHEPWCNAVISHDNDNEALGTSPKGEIIEY